MRLRVLLFALACGLCLAVRPALPEEGIASHYGHGDGFAGRRTANGERMDPGKMTCAHRRYRMGTILEVTDVKSGKRIQVRVNDRGPFVRGRVIDLSYGAFRRLSSRGGLANVRIRPVGYSSTKQRTARAYAVKKQARRARSAPEVKALRLVLDKGFYSQPLVTPLDKSS